MADYGITELGFNRKRLDLIINELDSEVRGIFGDDMNIEPESPDGQLIGIFGKALADLHELAEAAYLSASPVTASGVALTRLAAIGGLTRKDATPSSIILTLTGDDGTTVPAGSQASADGTEVLWVTEADVTIGPSGSQVVVANADVTGPTATLAGTVTGIESPVAGWSAVTNANAATLGTIEESDAELRTRFLTTRNVAGAGTVDAIYAAVNNLDGVTYVTVDENRSNATNIASGLPGHHVRVVVIGGDDQEIANAIWQNKPAGIALDGNEFNVITDSQGNNHFIFFSRPVPVQIKVTGALDVVSDANGDGVDTNIAQLINDSIVEWASTQLTVGEDVIGTKLYIPVHAAAKQHNVFDLRISRVDDPSNFEDVISISSEEVAAINSADITFLVL